MKKSIRIAVIITLIAIILVSSVALYGCQEKESYLEEDTTFYITKFSALGLPVFMVIDKDMSYVKLNKDGTCVMRITPNESLLNLLLQSIDINLSAESLESFTEQFLVGMFPGFDLNDVTSSIALLRSLNVKLVGFENGDPNYDNLKQQIESGKGIEKINLPENLAIEVNTTYSIKQLHSQYSGDYTAIYFGKYDSSYSQEPYIIFTMNDNEKGQTQLVGRFEILKSDLICVAK